jgi:arabinofuranan 3-O-arabinosyltransferase
VPATAVCRADLVTFDGQPLTISVDADTVSRLLAGEAVDVRPCDDSALNAPAGRHRITTSAGTVTGIDVDRVVLRDAAAAPVSIESPPQVTVDRTRTTRTATVTNCPTGCWLILGEGFNDGWQAQQGSTDLGPPRQISGGFNGWWLPGADSPVTVTMTWEPQRTMWIGMIVALLAVLACALLIWRDRARTDMTVPSAPTPDWPPSPVGRRQSVIAAAALVALACLTISPKYGLIAAVVGIAMVVLRRPVVAGAAALVLMAGLAGLIVRRQLRYRLVANPSWPAAFDDLHRLGLLVVVLLLACTVADDCRDQENEQLS